MNGFIHSFQSMGAVDGPGLRFVVFMQGCPLRCIYCHNPDTWDIGTGEQYSPDEVADRIKRFTPYFGKDGGVTVSGGEVLLQWEFCAELFEILKRDGIRTAIDTSGVGDLCGAERLLRYTDLVICDIKFSDEDGYMKYCKGSHKRVAEFLRLCERMNVPIWIRQVIVPGLNDSEENVSALIAEAAGYSDLEKIELLPFRKLCLAKYEALGIEFPLKNTAECPPETLGRLAKLIPEQYR